MFLIFTVLLITVGCNQKEEIPFFFNISTNTITGVDLDKISKLHIPSEINDIPVYTIASNAFESKDIKVLTFEEGIVNIEDHAFSDNLLSELELPTSLNSLGSFAFSGNMIEKLSTDYIENVYERPFLDNNITQYELTGNDQIENIDWMILKLGLSIDLISDLTFKDGFYFSLNLLMVVGYDNSYGKDVILPGKFALPDPDNPSKARQYFISVIGPYAFYDAGLTSVQFADNYNSILAYSFAHNFLTECPVCNREGVVNIGVGVGAFLDNQITEIISNSDLYVQEHAFTSNPIVEVSVKGNPFYFFGYEDYYGLPKFYEYDEFDSSVFPVIEVKEGLYGLYENYLYLMTQNELSIYKIFNGVNNLLFTMENDIDKKVITDMFVDENGVFYLLGYSIPEGEHDSDTYLPGFILEISKDFNNQEFHYLDNIGMRIPVSFTINSKNEFGIYGEGSDSEFAGRRYAFMIFDETYQRLLSYELIDDYYWGEYRRIISYNDSFFLAGVGSNQEICSKSECANLIIQEFNSSDYLVNSVDLVVEENRRLDVTGFFINDGEIKLFANNNNEFLKYYELNRSLEVTFSNYWLYNALIFGDLQNHNEKFYFLFRNGGNFAIAQIANGSITHVNFDIQPYLESPFDRWSPDLYLKLYILKYAD
jgi:hypothetical protein